MAVITHRIGCIVPSINVTVEDDFRTLCQSNTGVHFARADVDQSGDLAGQFEQMVDDAPRLAGHLAKAGVGVVAFACISASFFRGGPADRALAAAMKSAANIPAITTASAVLAALETVGARRIALATPYVRWVYEQEAAFLAEHDVAVVAANGLDRRGGRDISGITADEIRDLVGQVDTSAAEAIVVSCTDLPVLSLIEELEQKHGKPIITSNQATFWQCARTLGLGGQAGYGRLLVSP